jgi:predicted O-linked N-acetylglucosamine transferase (SPINDLY family)
MLGMDNWKACRFERAREAYLRAAALDPDYLPGWWGAFQYPECMVYLDEADRERFLADWRAGLERFERFDFARFPPELVSACLAQATNFYLHYLGQAFLDEQRRYGALITRMVAAALPSVRASSPLPQPATRRRRVAVCSGFVRRHTVMKLFGALITGLDRARFEVGVYYTDTLDNEGTRSVRDAVEHFTMGERPIEAWVDALRAFAPDVIVYPDIGMHPVIQALAALRLAPVQCMLWGHPVTSGLPAIDYFLSSDAMEPDDGERHYHERLVRLPNLGCCFHAPSDEPRVPAELAEKGERIDAFFAQSAYKIMPFHDDVLARIAAAVPALRLNLVPHPQPVVRERLRQRLRRAFAQRGVDFDAQVGVYRFVDEREFFGIAARADLNLDSIGWSGGNTTLEILWYDVPTVTLPGELMRSRHTGAILKRLELDELIARDVDDYVRIAVELARSADWRAELRQKIRERKHRLYDDRTVVAAFAEFLATAQPRPALT